jgi:hypothetical protein
MVFQKKTTIVIGAGASKEVGLPVGSELKNIISSDLDIKFDDFGREQKTGSHQIYSAITSIARMNNERTTREYIDACWKISNAMPQAISIDNFIDAHKGDAKIELCGKLAIASSILKAEKSSDLFIDQSNVYNKIDFTRTQKTWFNSFFQLITENCTADNLASRLSSITLIIFNYDRCIEQFLYHALQNYYPINKTRAKELVNLIEIYHPYGSIGNLPCLADGGVDYGAEVYTSILLDVYKKIKTFTEGTDPDSSPIQKIRKSIADCEILIFLGFSYQKQNLRLIKPTKEELEYSVSSKCYGTSLGLSKSSVVSIIDELSDFSNLSKENIFISDIDCTRLFYEHWRSLSWD